MTDQASASGQNQENPEDEKSFFQIIVHSFFIIPFLIAVFCVMLFAGIHLLTRENRTAYDYLEDIKTGGSTKRWQAAFELSKILANKDLIPTEERFADELIGAYKASGHDDPRVRQYLALAMGRTENMRYTGPLMIGLRDEKEGNLPAVIYALGRLKDERAVSVIQQYIHHDNARIRSMAVVALGTIGSEKSADVIRTCLNDSEPNVQWGAAVSLAKLGDASGKEILSRMLNRGYWTNFPQVDPEDRDNLMLTAIDAAAGLRDAGLNATIQQLAQADASMKIRSAAMEAVKNK